MEKLTRRQYTLEYKQEAVRLVSSGQRVATDAKALGVVELTLANWVKADEAVQLRGVKSEQVSAERMQLNRLRAELARVTMERDYWEKPRRTSRRCSDEVRLDREQPAVLAGVVQCRVLGVSASGYRQHRARRKKILTRRHLSETALLVMGEAITAELACRALDMAWHQRSPLPGLIFHSDRGSQYASGCYTDMLTGHGIRASMSRKGNCWDNACSETLFGSLKVERLHGMEFTNHREAKDAVMDWLLWYNRSRLHSTLGYRSPAQFEQQAHSQPHALAA